MRAEDEVDVALAINHERGLAVIVEFARIDLVRRFAHGAHAGLDGSDPMGRGVDVGGDIRIFVRPLIGDIRDALVVFAGGMLESANGIAIAVVGKVSDIGGNADATDGQGAEQSEEPAERGDRVDHGHSVLEKFTFTCKQLRRARLGRCCGNSVSFSQSLPTVRGTRTPTNSASGVSSPFPCIALSAAH